MPVSLLVILFICCVRHVSTSDPLPKYDEHTGRSAMFYSAAAYCHPLSLLQWNCGTVCSANPGIRIVHPIIYTSKNSFIFGFVSYNFITNKIIVTFHLNNSLQMNSTVFGIPQSSLSSKKYLSYTMMIFENGGKVHRECLRAYNTIKTQVRTFVNLLLKMFPQAQILITGHSLGGALATLAAIDLKRQHQTANVQLFTFGSPRVGNRAFVESVYALFPLGTIYRIVNAGDIVPHVPGLSQGYIHVGIEVWYPNRNDLTYHQCILDPSALVFEDPTCSSTQIVNLDISSHFQYLTYSNTNLSSLKESGECHIAHDNLTYADIRGLRDLAVQVSMKKNYSALLRIAKRSVICPGNCNSAGCHVNTGVCRGGCDSSINWWGEKCDKRCMGNCNSGGCRQSNGLCAGGCSDSTEWWGKQCDQLCKGHCNSGGCRQDSGLCAGGCSDSTKRWGPQCDKHCIGNCNAAGCRQGSGLCVGGCSDSTKWWGPQCDKNCIGNCNAGGCRQDSGLCAGGCSDSTKWWGKQCDQVCNGHCNSGGCRQDSGLCAGGSSGSLKWRETQYDKTSTTSLVVSSAYSSSFTSRSQIFYQDSWNSDDNYYQTNRVTTSTTFTYIFESTKPMNIFGYSLNVLEIFGIASGCVILLIIVVVVCVKCHKRKTRSNQENISLARTAIVRRPLLTNVDQSTTAENDLHIPYINSVIPQGVTRKKEPPPSYDSVMAKAKSIGLQQPVPSAPPAPLEHYSTYPAPSAPFEHL